MSRREPIAVVGIGCRFPQAHGPQEYWSLLDEGQDAIGPTPPYRDGGRSGLDPRLDRAGASVRGSLVDVERFDWRAFRISPRESTYIDPQQRLLLQTAWEALESAGIPHEAVAGTRAGVFVGIMWPDYAKLLAADPSRLAGYATSGAGFALAANRVSYQFDLRGPSVALDVQCASSLTAVHHACTSLWSGESELAFAGGVNLILTADADVMMSRAGILSPSGRCRPLDASADGFVRGEGVGLVVLKPLARARADGNRVLCVILGSSVNHDGRRAPLTTPSHDSQVELVSAACASAGIAPADLGYVELHGTGTRRGDPLEASALAAARGEAGRPDPCLVGSVKSNIGHCESAAGVASIVKVALALHHGRIPATLHHEQTNPEIPLDELGLRLVTETTAWPQRDGRPAIAGVTGLSLGGANAHVVLAAPADEAVLRAPAARPRRRETQLLALSARSRPALANLARAYAEALDERGDDAARIVDLAHTAALRRSHFEWRLAVVGARAGTLAEQLRSAAERLDLAGKSAPERLAIPAAVALAVPDAAAAERWAAWQAVPDVIVLVGDEDVAGDRALVSLPADARRADVLAAIAALYELGCAVRWERVVTGGRLTDAPTYRWAGERLWVDPAVSPAAAVALEQAL